MEEHQIIITIEHIVDVCKRGQGAACCRYLMTSPEGWCCARARGPAWEAMLDERVETMLARGTNCEGREGAVPLGADVLTPGFVVVEGEV